MYSAISMVRCSRACMSALGKYLGLVLVARDAVADLERPDVAPLERLADDEALDDRAAPLAVRGDDRVQLGVDLRVRVVALVRGGKLVDTAFTVGAVANMSAATRAVDRTPSATFASSAVLGLQARGAVRAIRLFEQVQHCRAVVVDVRSPARRASGNSAFAAPFRSSNETVKMPPLVIR